MTEDVISRLDDAVACVRVQESVIELLLSPTTVRVSTIELTADVLAGQINVSEKLYSADAPGSPDGDAVLVTESNSVLLALVSPARV